MNILNNSNNSTLFSDFKLCFLILAKGPGMFFIVPCIDSYTKVDLRTVTFDVPPQEVINI